MATPKKVKGLKKIDAIIEKYDVFSALLNASKDTIVFSEVIVDRPLNEVLETNEEASKLTLLKEKMNADADLVASFFPNFYEKSQNNAFSEVKEDPESLTLVFRMTAAAKLLKVNINEIPIEIMSKLMKGMSAENAIAVENEEIIPSDTNDNSEILGSGEKEIIENSNTDSGVSVNSDKVSEEKNDSENEKNMSEEPSNEKTDNEIIDRNVNLSENSSVEETKINNDSLENTSQDSPILDMDF